MSARGLPADPTDSWSLRATHRNPPGNLAGVQLWGHTTGRLALVVQPQRPGTMLAPHLVDWLLYTVGQAAAVAGARSAWERVDHPGPLVAPYALPSGFLLGTVDYHQAHAVGHAAAASISPTYEQARQHALHAERSLAHARGVLDAIHILDDATRFT